MPQQFDQILASQIRNVFDNHEEAYNPADWENMRARLGKKPNSRVVWLFPFIAKAASVIFLLGLSVFSVNNHLDFEKGQKLLVWNTTDENFTDFQDSLSSEVKSPDSEILYNTKQSPPFGKVKTANTSADTSLLFYATIPSVDSTQVINPVLYRQDSSKRILAEIRQVLDNHHNKMQKMTSSQIKGNNNALYTSTDELGTFENADEKKETLKFGIELTTISSYSPGSTNTNMNVGGGISASYKISRKLSVATGVLIAKQSLEYGNGSSKFFANNKMDYAYDQTLNMIDASSTENNLKFIALDIPVNLKYKHKNFIFSAGISSLVFLNEEYSYNYNAMVNTIAFNPEKAQYESRNSYQNISSAPETETLNHIDFAGLLNISVAYDYPLNKGSIALEPYLKIPLANLGSQEVRMGSGGIALRYNF
jgi:hypothetical protein